MDSKEHDPAGAFPDYAWRAAKFCGPNGGNCVEVNLGARGATGIRDSKAGGGPVLAFGHAGWETFLADTKAGRLGRE